MSDWDGKKSHGNGETMYIRIRIYISTSSYFGVLKHVSLKILWKVVNVLLTYEEVAADNLCQI